MPPLRRPEDAAFFAERYGRNRGDAARTVETAVLGQDVGLNGYTTPEQARALAQALKVGPGYRLLDLGAGRGWPGNRITAVTGCRTVLTDLPFDALKEARTYAAAEGVALRTSIVVSDGQALPFPDAHFDAISHADVFC